MGKPWRDKLKQWAAFLAEFGVAHPIEVKPKERRVSGPVPRLPDGWHESSYQDLMGVRCVDCGGEIVLGSGQIKAGRCGSCYSKMNTGRRRGDAA